MLLSVKTLTSRRHSSGVQPLSEEVYWLGGAKLHVSSGIERLRVL